MSTFIFKTETSISPSWADVTEGLNAYYAGPNPGLDEIDHAATTDHEQQINTYVKIDNKIGLYKGSDSALAIGISEPVAGQTLGIKHINFDLIKEKLTGGVKALYFGYLFDGEIASQADVVQKSIYFGRNTLTNRITNFETGEEIEYNVKYAAAIWMVFYKIKDTDIYYVVTNNNLLDPTIIRQDFLDTPEFDNSEDTFSVMNSHDGNFKTCLFRPSLDGAEFVGPNIISTTNDSFTIDTLGLSRLHFINKSFIKDKDLPAIDLQYRASVPVEQKKQKLTVDMTDKQIATISYRWETGTELDTLASKEEMPRYDFVIVKL
jgi:hypothetical protein